MKKLTSILMVLGFVLGTGLATASESGGHESSSMKGAVGAPLGGD